MGNYFLRTETTYNLWFYIFKKTNKSIVDPWLLFLLFPYVSKIFDNECIIFNEENLMNLFILT